MVSLSVKAVRHSRAHFDVELSGDDIVGQRRLSRDVLRIILSEFRKTGRIRVGNAEANFTDKAERARACEMAEAVMREEIL